MHCMVAQWVGDFCSDKREFFRVSLRPSGEGTLKEGWLEKLPGSGNPAFPVGTPSMLSVYYP
jgi:hypothetical protein